MKQIFSKQNRALLAELVRTDFKLRYQGSALGYLWSLLKPLFIFGILYIVFVRFIKLGGDIPNYPIYLLLGIVIWNFFSEMTGTSLSSVVGRGDLIRKIRIPRWIIIVSTSVAAVINLGLNLIVVAVFMAFSDIDISRYIVFLPLLFLQLYLLALGCSLFLSAAYVKFRDISYIWDVILQAGFYATPILYPLSIVVNTTYQKILLLNPIAQIVQDSRYLLVTKETTTVHSVYGSYAPYIITIAITLAILLAGLQYFKKQSKTFAENL
jgi:ABC-2 type transport system permease protein